MTQGAGNRSRGSDSYDVAIVGAGPAGCVTALAFAERGARVLLLEANPQSSRRLAGEWIHPPAVDILKRFGVEPRPVAPFLGGRGFVVFPDDGSRPVVLPYATGTFAYSFEHSSLVDTLREHCDANRLVDYMPYSRATELRDHRLTYQVESGGSHIASADLLVGACGRMSVAHTALGIRRSAGTYSRMAGLVLKNVEMPFEGYGHVCLGGLGPILAYRIDAEHVRVQLDVPLSLRLRRDRQAVLYEAYAPALPEQIRPSFREALRSGGLMWATNQIRPRVEFGREGLALVGDAVGYHHPLTAVGMTMGFQDAVALANAKSFSAYRRERILRSRVPEMLAVALYEIFADTSDEVVAIRRAIYDLWRKDSLERFQTMRFLGCQDTNPVTFGTSFYKAVLLAGKTLVRRGISTGRWDHVRDVSADLADRSRWLLAGALHLQAATPVALGQKNLGGEPDQSGSADERYGAALRASSAKADVVELPFAPGRSGMKTLSPALALERGARALVALQDSDGSWEGEVIGSAGLTAQYVLTAHLMGRAIDPVRRRRLLLQFERSRSNFPLGGLWGPSPGAQPDLATTTLVYAASRVLGIASNDAVLSEARSFIRGKGGIEALRDRGPFGETHGSDTHLQPSLWLAMMNVSSWDGVRPTLPELWSLPRWLPTHPSRHDRPTRLLHLGLSALFGSAFKAPPTPLSDALRVELAPGGVAGGHADRDVGSPGKALALFERALFGERSHHAGGNVTSSRRATALSKVLGSIRTELRRTDHAGISPVCSLLHMLALHAHDPADEDVAKAWAELDGWIWEDDVDGARVTAARSSAWDTSLALQALVEVAPHVEVRRAIQRADRFLACQQIPAPFSAALHGWPVSDCAAQALIGRVAAGEALGGDGVSRRDVDASVRFLLRAQNADGGFGSYAPRRTRFVFEWLHLADAFGDAMAEGSAVECTASALSALASARDLLDDPTIVDEPIRRGTQRLRESQHPTGAWPGLRGVRLIYGTLFGIRGLLAGGARPTDPSIRKACTFLKDQQRPDGSWGEAYRASPSDTFEPSAEGQVTQTAWALAALLAAEDADWDAIDRAARWIASMQLGSGEWPRQPPSAVFFHGALADCTLYRSYFPLWALGQYETRRMRRTSLYDHAGAEPTAAE